MENEVEDTARPTSESCKDMACFQFLCSLHVHLALFRGCMHAGRQARASEEVAEALSSAAHMPLDMAAAATEHVLGRARQLAGGMAAHADAQPQRPLVHEDSGQMRQADHRVAPGAGTAVCTAVQQDSAEAGSMTGDLPAHKQQHVRMEAESGASVDGMAAEKAAPDLAGPGPGADASAPDLEAASPSELSSTEEVSMLAACDAGPDWRHAVHCVRV